MIASNGRNDIFHVICKECGGEYKIFLNEEDYDTWNRGDALIQDVLYYLTNSEREMLISAVCDKCWKKIYGEI